MKRLQIQMNPKILNSVVANFFASKEYENMLISDEYYESKNREITLREKKMMLFNEKEEPYLADDFSKANHKLHHGFHYELVNQTKNYICGKLIAISWKDEAKVNDKVKEEINNIIFKYNDWGLFNQENVKNAQKYANGWFRVVIDNNGNLKLINVNSKEVISFVDDFGALECVIRVFEKAEYDSEGRKVVVKYAEVYDDLYKDVYTMKKGKYTLSSIDVPLLQKEVVYENGVTISGPAISWKSIPWVQWKFNSDKIDALTPIKNFIDMLDIDLSDLANNVDDVQDIIWVLENYQGQSIEQFMEDLKIKKAINVGEGGSVQSEKAEIPYAARMQLYEACEKNIYRFGRGIDFAKRDQLGNSTGVALKWSYGPLDEKADEIEQNGQSALNQLFNLMLVYINEKGISTGELDSNSVEFIFDRTMINNEKEIIESVIRSSSLLSIKTQLENHPMVDDADEELTRLLDPVSGSTEEVPPNDGNTGTTDPESTPTEPKQQ